MGTWLVTGAQGFLGTTAGHFLQGKATAVGLVRQGLAPRYFKKTIAVDLRDINQLERDIRLLKPAVISHAAAISGHETAANDPLQARQVNVDASRVLAQTAQDIGASVIYISTDALFSGSRGQYSEDEPVDPFSLYGETKFQGEDAVRDSIQNHLIVRTNFFGWSDTGNKSILEFFVNSLRNRMPVLGYPDFIVSSIYAPNLLESIWKLHQLGVCGTINVASSDAVSKYAFGKQIANTFGLDSSLIASQSSAASTLQTSRCRNLSLDTAKATAALGHRLISQEEGILECLSR